MLCSATSKTSLITVGKAMPQREPKSESFLGSKAKRLKSLMTS